MTILRIQPPQGFTSSQELIFIGGPVSPRFSSPQGTEGGGIPTFNDESYVIGGERGSVAYVIGGDRGKVDYEDLV